MYQLSDFHRGDHIKIHPACDLFMRGETHATIKTVGRKYLRIAGHRSQLLFSLHPDNVLEITHHAPEEPHP